MLIAYGHMKDRSTPVSFPLAIQDMHYVVLCFLAGTPCKNGRKAFTSAQASISVNWAIGGVCKVFLQVAHDSSATLKNSCISTYCRLQSLLHHSFGIHCRK